MLSVQKSALMDKLNNADRAPLVSATKAYTASDNMHLVADLDTTDSSSTISFVLVIAEAKTFTTLFHLGAKSERTAAVDVATPMG